MSKPFLLIADGAKKSGLLFRHYQVNAVLQKARGSAKRKPQFVSGSLQMVPGDAMPKMLGPSYQIDLCAAPGVEYGKTRLEVNPDSSENFIMLKH